MDRLVGAPSPTEPGLFYQWGDIIGHGLADGYSFDEANYRLKELNNIASDLDDAHDAARAYYGQEATMPSTDQVEELIQYTTFRSVATNVLQITSILNGNSLIVTANGRFNGTELASIGGLRVWTAAYINSSHAYSIHDRSVSSRDYRYFGLNIMAVHS